MKVQKSHLRIALFILVAAVLYNVFLYLRPAARPALPQIPQAPLIATAPAPAADGQIDPLSIRAPHDVDLARVPGYSRDPFLFGDETREIVRAACSRAGRRPGACRPLDSLLARPAASPSWTARSSAWATRSASYRVAEIEQGAVVFAPARRRAPASAGARRGAGGTDPMTMAGRARRAPGRRAAVRRRPGCGSWCCCRSRWGRWCGRPASSRRA